jgi:hypothetical protein
MLIDFAKSSARRLGGSHSGGSGHGRLPSPVAMADRVYKAATRVAESLAGRFAAGKSAEERAALQWWTAAELSALFLRMLENHLAERIEGSHGEMFLRAFFDVCAGNIHRAGPHHDSFCPQVFLQTRLTEYRRDNADFADLFAPAPLLFERVSGYVAERWAPPDSETRARLSAAVLEGIQNAVALDLTPALR